MSAVSAIGFCGSANAFDRHWLTGWFSMATLAAYLTVLSLWSRCCHAAAMAKGDLLPWNFSRFNRVSLAKFVFDDCLTALVG